MQAKIEVVNPKKSIKETRQEIKELKRRWLTELREKGIKFRSFYASSKYFEEDHRVIVASRYSPQTSILQLQFAFCSAKDRFDRVEGQFIAAERLMESPINKKLIGSVIDIIKEAIIEEGNRLTTVDGVCIKKISWMSGVTKSYIR